MKSSHSLWRQQPPLVWPLQAVEHAAVLVDQNRRAKTSAVIALAISRTWAGSTGGYSVPAAGGH